MSRIIPREGRAAPLALAFLLSACLGDQAGVGMSANRPADPAPLPAGGGEVARAGTDRATATSQVLDALSARQGVVPASGPYAAVAAAVLAASEGPAAAELRVARLKAEARSRNWLPSLGPGVSLTSLSTVAASILLDQAILDNGRRKAEREFAAADVEVAAVTLAGDLNARVHDGLARYVEGRMAAAQGRVAEAAAARMAEWSRVAEARVAGGIADRSESGAIAQKHADLRRMAAADREALRTAEAELAALTDGVLPAADGLSALGASDAVPLPVLRAEAEGRRLRAEARIARSGLLPGLRASAGVSGGGIDVGADIGADKLLNLGTRSDLDALAAAGAVADQRLAEARDTVDRRRVALERQIAALDSEQTETAALLAETREGVALYEAQQEVGRRSLLDLASLYETQARLERDLAGLPYRIALLRLQLAQLQGTLVGGEAM